MPILRSFGILVWEICTMGNQPYHGLDNKEVVEFIKLGGFPNIPSKCPTEL